MIQVEALQKLYPGDRGLRSFDLHVAPGELVGLVGPNGAGKTTLIKILATLLAPDSGVAMVNHLDLVHDKRAVRKLVGHMPDVPGVYQDMKVREFLRFFADAYHLPAHRRNAAVDEILEWSGLADRADAFVEHLSLGWKQRLVLAKTLLHGPALLLLDEPATGLDPLARLELRRQLKELHRRGVTILVSSHILSDLEDVCTRIVFIADGKNMGQAQPQTAGAAGDPRPVVYEIEFLPSAQAQEIARGVGGVQVLASSEGSLRISVLGGREQIAQVVKALAGAGVGVFKVQPASALESQYQQMFGGQQ
ncbi:MAG TPA: ABC transporter ATP-binding protein [Candidatus Angelobacter sp.]|nr:ABC transporter ATP-binding protein [Candidatus Angelobacter sp.]